MSENTTPTTGANETTQAQIVEQESAAPVIVPTPKKRQRPTTPPRTSAEETRRAVKRHEKNVTRAARNKRADSPLSDLPTVSTEPTKYPAPGFAIFPDAFDTLNERAEVMRQKIKTNATGFDKDMRPGWTRSLWIDVEERNARPVIVARGKDIVALDGESGRNHLAALCYNDETGAPRAFVLAQFGKTDAKSAEKVCDQLNTYFSARFGRLSERYKNVTEPRALALLPLLIAQFGNDPQRFGRFGAISAAQQAREEKEASALLTKLERMKQKGTGSDILARAMAMLNK